MVAKEIFMNKDRVEGKLKDVAGRVQRQTGEWTDDPEAQAKGAAKQVSGKVQNAWGKTKDAVNRPTGAKPPQRTADDAEAERPENRRRSNG
jgi:uncharacterized protein YjbJ (UPF0337 family)